MDLDIHVGIHFYSCNFPFLGPIAELLQSVVTLSSSVSSANVAEQDVSEEKEVSGHGEQKVLAEGEGKMKIEEEDKEKEETIMEGQEKAKDTTVEDTAESPEEKAAEETEESPEKTIKYTLGGLTESQEKTEDKENTEEEPKMADTGKAEEVTEGQVKGTDSEEQTALGAHEEEQSKTGGHKESEAEVEIVESQTAVAERDEGKENKNVEETVEHKESEAPIVLPLEVVEFVAILELFIGAQAER